MERAVLVPDPSGYHLAGTVLTTVAGAPTEIRYSVLTDPGWRTRVVGIHVQTGDASRRLALRADGEGAWTSGQAPLALAQDALDVDMAFTPATNTLPIRRLGLEVGESAEITVVHVAADGAPPERRIQHYTRLAADRYRYEGRGAPADLSVSAGGFVVEYPGLWRQIG